MQGVSDVLSESLGRLHECGAAQCSAEARWRGRSLPARPAARRACCACCGPLQTLRLLRPAAPAVPPPTHLHLHHRHVGGGHRPQRLHVRQLAQDGLGQARAHGRGGLSIERRAGVPLALHAAQPCVPLLMPPTARRIYLQAPGVAAEKICVPRGVRGPHAQRVNVCARAVHAQAVRAEREDLGVGVLRGVPPPRRHAPDPVLKG